MLSLIRGGVVLNGENAGEAIASAQLIFVVFEVGKEPDDIHQCQKLVDASDESLLDGWKNESVLWLRVQEGVTIREQEAASGIEDCTEPAGGCFVFSYGIGTVNHAFREREGGEVDESEEVESMQNRWILRLSEGFWKGSIEIGVTPKNGAFLEGAIGILHCERLSGFSESLALLRRDPRRDLWVAPFSSFFSSLLQLNRMQCIYYRPVSDDVLTIDLRMFLISWNCKHGFETLGTLDDEGRDEPYKRAMRRGQAWVV